MPTYTFSCASDHETSEVRRIADCDEPMECPKCGQPAERVYKAPPMISSFKGHFNPSLGRYIGSAGDIRDAQNKIQDETGSRPIEIGNEKPKYQPQKQDVNMREVLAYAEKLQTERGERVNA